MPVSESRHLEFGSGIQTISDTLSVPPSFRTVKTHTPVPPIDTLSGTATSVSLATTGSASFVNVAPPLDWIMSKHACRPTTGPMPMAPAPTCIHETSLVKELATPATGRSDAYAEVVEDRRAGHVDSGHLELDESRNVMTGATELEVDHVGCVPEVLEGPDGPSWAERLEDAGITHFVRRRRAALACVMVAATVAVVGAALYVRTRPPPDDGVVAVTIEPAPTSEGVVGGGLSADGVMTLGYRLTPARSTDTLRALGLVGPAVRASSVHVRTEGAPGQPVLVDVSLVPGCDDPRSVTSTLVDYGLRVERTDSFGRAVVDVVPLVNQSDDLVDQFIDLCTGDWLGDGLRAESVRTAVDPRGRTVYLTIRVRSSLIADVMLEPRDFTTDRILPVAVLPTGPPARIPLGGAGTVQMGLFVRDCSTPRLPDAVETDPFTGTTGTPRPGLPLQGWVPVPGTDRSHYGDVTLAWPDGTRATIQAALNRLCRR